MRLSALFLLPLLVAAEQQPLQDKAAAWFDKAKSYVGTGAKAPMPIEAGAAQVATKKVERINQSNWQRKLAPKREGPEEWMVYMTGGNKSCYGRCGPADEAWNLAVPLILATPSPPHLGIIDCEREDIICTAWGAAVPHVWWFSFPQKPADESTSTPLTPLYILPINHTNVTTHDFVTIAADKYYLAYPEYKGAFHPIDGILMKYQLLIPFGYVLWGFGTTPSWLMMLGVSFISRQMMSRRANHPGGLPTGPSPPTSGQRAAPPAPAPAPAANPRGGSRKRK